MKKILTILFMAVTAMTFVSCDDDKIANSLEGIWSGTVETDFFYDRWGNSAASYQSVDIKFYVDPSQYAKGSGIEYDYMQDNYHYSTCEFTFEVKNRRIYIYYADNTRVVIHDYSLDGDRFSGVFCNYDTGRELARFEFYRITNWRAASKFYINDNNEKIEIQKIPNPAQLKAATAE